MKGYKKLPHRVLAEGEATGHSHTADSSATLWGSDSGSLVLEVPIETTVTHEEHKPVVLPNGEYDVVRVKEFDHFAEEARQVQD